MLEYLQDEATLVKQAIAGDAQAFGSLYSQHQEAIYRYICARVRNAIDAEDLTEQVFLKAWEALPGYEQRDNRFTSWLYRIAHNMVVDHYRVQNRTIPASLLDTGDWDTREPTTLDKIVADEEVAALTRAVDRLPEEQKRVIMLRFVEGLNHAQIADILAKSTGACRIIQHRALTALNHMLNSTLSMILAVLLLLGGTVVASSRAVPGNALYSVKRSVESLQLAISPGSAEVIRLRLALADRRVEEAVSLAHQQQADAINVALYDYQLQYNAILDILNDVSSLSREDKATIAQLVITAQSDDVAQLADLRDIAPASAYPILDAALETSQTVHDRAQQELDAQTPPPPTPSPVLPALTPTPESAAIPLDSSIEIDRTATTQMIADAVQPTFVPTASAGASPNIDPGIPAPSASVLPLPGSTATPLPAIIPSVPVPAAPSTTPTAVQVAIAPPTATPSPLPPTPTFTAIPPSPTPTLPDVATVSVATPTPSLTATQPLATPTASDTATLPPPVATRTSMPIRPSATPAATSTVVVPTPSATWTPAPTSTTTPQNDPAQVPPPDTSNPPTSTPTPLAEASDDIDQDRPGAPTQETSASERGRTQIKVEQTVSQDSPASGEQVTFTITLRNPGEANLFANIVNQLPGQVTYVTDSASPRGFYVSGTFPTLLWNELRIPAQSETTITFQVTAGTVDTPTRVVNRVFLEVENPQAEEDEEFAIDPLSITIQP